MHAKKRNINVNILYFSTGAAIRAKKSIKQNMFPEKRTIFTN